MELLGDAETSHMEITGEHSAEESSPGTAAIAAIGRLLSQRINGEVQEYTVVLGKLVEDLSRPNLGCEPARDSGGGGDGGSDDPTHSRCSAAILLRMHTLMSDIGRALDKADADQ